MFYQDNADEKLKAFDHAIRQFGTYADDIDSWQQDNKTPYGTIVQRVVVASRKLHGHKDTENVFAGHYKDIMEYSNAKPTGAHIGRDEINVLAVQYALRQTYQDPEVGERAKTLVSQYQETLDDFDYPCPLRFIENKFSALTGFSGRRARKIAKLEETYLSAFRQDKRDPLGLKL
jgi:hypothetical protein